MKDAESASVIPWSTRYMPVPLLNRLRACSGQMPRAGWTKNPSMTFVLTKALEVGLPIIEAQLTEAIAKSTKRKP